MINELYSRLRFVEQSIIDSHFSGVSVCYRGVASADSYLSPFDWGRRLDDVPGNTMVPPTAHDSPNGF